MTVSPSRRQFLGWATGLGGTAIGAASPGKGGGRIRRSDWHTSGDDGVALAVREVWHSSANHRRLPPVVLLHGARVPGVASFDLPVHRGSLAADMAVAGHRVYIMDARGYGASTRPPAMDRPPTENPPQVTGVEVVRDITAVVRAVRQRSGRDTVALVGWATGGHWLAWYATRHPRHVSHLVLFNSLYGAVDGHPTLGRGSQYEDPDRPGEFNATAFGAYRLSTGASLLPGWDDSIPAQDKNTWRDPMVVDAYLSSALASDPTSGQRRPPSFRAPTGALSDSFHLATGRRLWRAQDITAPTLVLRSQYDFWSRPEDMSSLREELTRAAAVRTVELTEATHFAHLDRMHRGRAQLLHEMLTWLAT